MATSTKLRERAQSRFSYQLRQYRKEYLSIKKRLGNLVNIPEPEIFKGTRGLTTQRIKSRTKELARLRSSKFEAEISVNAWKQYMTCLSRNAQNKYDDFLNSYGLNPSLEIINSVFNSPNFKACNEFESLRRKR